MKNLAKRQRGFAVFEVLLFVLLAAVIAGGAYYIGTRHNKDINGNSNSNSSSTKNSTNTSSTTSKTDPTADWQTHTGADYSIKYPKNWKFYAKGDPFPIAGDSGEVSSNTDATNDYLQSDPTEVGSITLTVSAYVSNLDAGAYLEQVFPNGEAPQGEISNKQNFNVGKYSATTYTLTYLGHSSYKTTVSNKQKVIYFDYSSEQADSINKIVRTVKIL